MSQTFLFLLLILIYIHKILCKYYIGKKSRNFKTKYKEHISVKNKIKHRKLFLIRIFIN